MKYSHINDIIGILDQPQQTHIGFFDMKKLTYLLKGLEYRCDKDISELKVDFITSDSRKTLPDSLFIAIKGAAADGHDYADKAYKNGCRIFLCQRPIEGLGEDAYVIITPNTRRGLAAASAAFYSHPAKKLKIIALTGTKGKTTTAYLIYSILRAEGKRAAYIGSNGIDYDEFHYDTANTTPESCELHYHFSKMVSAGIEYVAMEISSQALYMDRVYGIEFDTVVFTNLAPDHIGGDEHPTFEHYKGCKRSLFYDYKAKNMVYNADDEASAFMVNPALSLYPISAQGKGSLNAVQIKPYSDDGVLGISFTLDTGRDSYKVKTRSPGYFSSYNAMCAMACAKLCGVSFSSSAMRLAEISVLGRFECVDVASDRVFIIDYAHNGFSLSSVLHSLADYPHNRLICLYGSVGGRTKGRRAELGRVACDLCDLSIITSDNPDYEPAEEIIADIAAQYSSNDDRILIPDREKAIEHAVRISEPGDIILLAGKGHENYQLIEGKKVPFCERELVKKYAQLYLNTAKIPVEK